MKNPGLWLTLLSIRLIASHTAAAQEVQIPLNDGWTFCQAGKEVWRSAEVPGVVQTDLLHHRLIPDFMLGSNIDSVQWIENEDWIYRRSLFVTDTFLQHQHLDLVFKGLDTFAEVYLNDSLIGKADNMFRTWEWEVKRHLKIGENELKVVFRSPLKEGAKMREAYGIQLPHDSDPSGVSPYIRKAAYQFGWDFCPRLVTSGIWKEVELRGWSEDRIERIGAFEVLTKDGFMASCAIETIGESDSMTALHVRLGEQHQLKMRLPRQRSSLVYFPLDSADLWYPHRPKTFLLEVKLYRGDVLLSTSSRTVGFSDIELVRSPEAVGSSFNFTVNGKPEFMKGCNMVPPSLLPGPSSIPQWLTLVQRMKEAGMNMVRLWAGGVYPPEEFLHACDTAGILLWQDVMVGNLGPFDDHIFEENIGREVVEQYKRISLHPCLALFCGNNELDVAWKNWGWQQRYGLHGQDSMKVAAVNDHFFNRRLKEWIQEMGNTGYLPSSPVSNWGNAKGLIEGDLHYWGVWHGDSTFSSFRNNVGRFVSEWGFQSYPDSALLAKYIDPDSLYLGSPTVARLQRSYKTDRPIWEAIERELGEEHPTTLGGFIEASQRVQARAYGMAIEAHQKALPHCMGTLLWQLNDCWPGPSWSIIDYKGNPKPAYGVVKEHFLRTP
jgi:beta-mannosidase